MSWVDAFMPLAEWALRQQDLRHQYIYAKGPTELTTTPGIARTLEATIILSIYEAALGKGYMEGVTLGYEKAYPTKRKRAANPKRADLAFKDQGRGKNWGYVEVKCYGGNGKYWVAHDIKKLKKIKQRSQRWMFVYRVHKKDGKSPTLGTLLLKNFRNELKIHSTSSFSTKTADAADGVCELCLAKVL